MDNDGADLTTRDRVLLMIEAVRCNPSPELSYRIEAEYRRTEHFLSLLTTDAPAAGLRCYLQALAACLEDSDASLSSVAIEYVLEGERLLDRAVDDLEMTLEALPLTA